MNVKEKLHTYRNRIFRCMDVPDDLGPITDIDPNEETDEEKTGLTPATVKRLWTGVEEVYRSGVHPMLSLCVRRHGHIVLNRSIGYTHGVMGDEGEPVVASLDTPVCLFSASKAVTAMLIHKLAEDRIINLLDPVSYYIPAFAARGKSSITLYQMLGHRAGVPGITSDVPLDVLFNPQEALRLICATEGLHREGRITAYHAITSGFVLEELIRVTTGKTINEYLDETIRQPMGMRYFSYGLAPEWRPQVARNYSTGLRNPRLVERKLSGVLGVSVDEAVAISNTEEFLRAQIPAGNLYATAEEAGRFFQMLLDHGDWQGRAILQPLTVHRATRETGRPQLDRSLLLPMRYSAGMMLGGAPVGLYGVNTHFAYGHIGLSNILCWADPQRALSVSLVNTGKPVLGNHLAAMLKLIFHISHLCEPCVDMLQDEPHYHRRAS